MKIQASNFKTVEDFCRAFSYLNECKQLSFLYENWTDYFCSTFSKQFVIECCEDYYSNTKINKDIVAIIEGLYDETDYDGCLDED
jgi:hypothetical protein